ISGQATFGSNASISGNLEIGANGFVIRSAGVSSSLAFETTSYASASALWGAGLSNCGSTNKLQWGSGTFTCVADQLGGGGAANIQIRELDGDSVSPVATITFHADHFTVTASAGSATDAVIALDWTNGPASRTADQTISGFWAFDNSASISGNLEVEGTASVSGAVTLNGALTSYGNNTFNGTNTFNARTDFGANASSTADFEIAGFASSSFLYGSALSTCTASQKLQWGSGVFSCVTDLDTDTIKDLAVRELGSFDDQSVATISFHPDHFNLTASNSEDVIVKLDWTNGPASRTADQTISGFWNFTGNASVSNKLEVYNTTGTASLELFANNNSSQRYLLTTASESLQFRNNAGTALVTLASGGNVGIGTSRPEVKLHVLGATKIEEAPGASGNIFEVERDDGFVRFWVDGTGDPNWTTATGGNLTLTGQFNVLNASISGNLEIGANGFVIRSAGVSSSLAFETTSYASASALYGSGLQTC
ncbi:MAG: hypothetical protein Q8O55_12580, partial [Dehalococcoidales bacterium]|nr:hypothetical protein [Dehalococcoidales bacterium]